MLVFLLLSRSDFSASTRKRSANVVKLRGRNRRPNDLKWSELLQLWSQIENGHTPAWRDGEAFEYLILRAFELEGAEVVWPYTVQIQDTVVEQIDGFFVSATNGPRLP